MGTVSATAETTAIHSEEIKTRLLSREFAIIVRRLPIL